MSELTTEQIIELREGVLANMSDFRMVCDALLSERESNLWKSYLPILAKEVGLTTQWSQFSSGWYEELINAVKALRARAEKAEADSQSLREVIRQREAADILAQTSRMDERHELKTRAEKAEKELSKHQESEFHPDWSMLQATRESLREHMQIGKELTARAEKAEAEVITKQSILNAIEHNALECMCDCEGCLVYTLAHGSDDCANKTCPVMLEGVELAKKHAAKHKAMIEALEFIAGQNDLAGNWAVEKARQTMAAVKS